MNNDLLVLFKCRKTLIQLLRDRGYDVPLVYDCDKLSEFKQIHQAKRLDIFVKEPKKCYVKFVIINKTRPQMIRDYLEDIKKKYITDDNDSIIIILKNKPHNTLFKLSKEFKNIQFFWLEELVNNITHHSLNPKFEKLTPNQVSSLLKHYSLTSKYFLPITLYTDPIAKYYNFVSGDVFKVTRSSITNGVYISYRCIK